VVYARPRVERRRSRGRSWKAGEESLVAIVILERAAHWRDSAKATHVAMTVAHSTGLWRQVQRLKQWQLTNLWRKGSRVRPELTGNPAIREATTLTTTIAAAARGSRR
jgi:hypothetical protein